MTGLFRQTQRALSSEEAQLVNDIKTKAEELEALFQKAAEMTQASRYTSLAITSLEQAVMWVVKHITI